MNDVFFTMNGNKYIVKYENNTTIFYKENNNKIELLNDSELKLIKEEFNKQYGYMYNSEYLLYLVENNSNIDSKEYIYNFLDWLERVIPENCRDNLYRNIRTLKLSLKLDLNFDDISEIEREESGNYNTRENTIFFDVNNLKELWNIAISTENPKEFYYKHYSQTILHELTHMSSSNYNNGISLCGFDKFPASDEEDENRGLTEGLTELIAFAGVPNTIELSSNYYIEASICNQISQLIGFPIMLESYFSNKGIYSLKEKLCSIINDGNKAYSLFRNIELNYLIRNNQEKQSILGSIQMSILDYLEEILRNKDNIEEIENMLNMFGNVLITKEKLELMQRNIINYPFIEESVNRFNSIKEKCLNKKRD